MLKPYINVIVPYIYVLMNIIFFATNEIVKWAPSMLFTIPKKGNLKFVTNWRGIQMCEFICAWYDRILCNRINLWMNLDEFQTAYQKGKGCNTQIFTFRVITELAKRMKRPVYISYVDLEKAFDQVRRSTMLRVLASLGIGSVMLSAIKNLYSVTKVFLNGVGEFVSTSGIRQGASSSVYIFVIFINGLFSYLRNIFPSSDIFGSIHCLIHADDTLILGDDLEDLKDKVLCTYNFFNEIDQKVNMGKSKYMCLDNSTIERNRDSICINGQLVGYTAKEKYLGHHITDDNLLRTSIDCDIAERSSEVLVKYRNFINNNASATIQIRLKVFQACFSNSILSNCEVWGHYFPKKLCTLYNKGLRLALGVRASTPTVLIFLESRQPCVKALVIKRQLKFWQSLAKGEGSEMLKLLTSAKNTLYIKHYLKLENMYETPEIAFEALNKTFYDDAIHSVMNCKNEQTKLKTYKNIYDLHNIHSLPVISFTLSAENEYRRFILTRYIVSSSNLMAVIGRWSGDNKTCAKCQRNEEETLEHFIFMCDAYSDIRNQTTFPTNLNSFFKWNQCGYVLEQFYKLRGN